MKKRVVFTILVVYCFSLCAQLQKKLGTLASSFKQLGVVLNVKPSGDTPPPLPLRKAPHPLPRNLTKDLSKLTFYRSVGELLHLNVLFVNILEAEETLKDWGVSFRGISKEDSNFFLDLFVSKKTFQDQLDQAKKVLIFFMKYPQENIKNYDSAVKYLKWYNLYPEAQNKSESEKLKNELEKLFVKK